MTRTPPGPFSATVTDHWHDQFRGEVIARGDGFSAVVNPALPDRLRLMVLEPVGGATTAVMTPAVADQLAISGAPLSFDRLAHRAAGVGLALNDPDQLAYFAAGELARLGADEQRQGIRRLTARDAAVFADFTAGASPDDVDEAYVELDHWLVYGSFDGDRLAAVASMYPWQDSRLADVGVLTLEMFRGRGHARDVVRAISAAAAEQGYEAQYRCQLTNAGSLGVARAAGLSPFGTWYVVADD